MAARRDNYIDGEPLVKAPQRGKMIGRTYAKREAQMRFGNVAKKPKKPVARATSSGRRIKPFKVVTPYPTFVQTVRTYGMSRREAIESLTRAVAITLSQVKNVQKIKLILADYVKELKRLKKYRPERRRPA